MFARSFCFVIAILIGSVGVHAVNQLTVQKQELKSYTITYRVDEGDKRGKPQTTTVLAENSSKAKEEFRRNNPNATIISCTENPK
jgi:hypothetical protein